MTEAGALAPPVARFTPLAAAAEAVARLRPADLRLANRACGLAAREGDAARLERVARRALEAVARDPARLTFAAPRPPRWRALDQAGAAAALADLQAVAEAAGVRVFLMFGALLGAVREGRFIRGDADVDLGLLGADGRLPDLAARAGFAVQTVRAAGAPKALKIRHANGTELDLKLMRPDGAGGVRWRTAVANIVLTKHFPGPFEVAPMRAFGVETFAPHPAEALLEWQYGPGWTRPDPDYHGYTCGPVHGEAHARFIRAIGGRATLRALLRSPPRTALRFARNLARTFPEDPLWPRLASAVAEAGDAREEAEPPSARG